MKQKDKYYKQALIICLVFLIILMLAYFFRSRLHISISLPEKSELTKPLKGTMRCTLISTIQDSHYLRMQLVVPYKDRKHWIEIKKVLPRVKNEFIMAINQEGMEEVVRERNFDVIRSLLLSTFNRNLKRPIDNVYFENFFYD
ncbi:MAG: hypothetical protein DRH12_18325 [Deltaproteobacteria bacterium]|nr:MAG: hypothetical protein DRH12_18325 [Deltaproteobacteria bacterium]